MPTEAPLTYVLHHNEGQSGEEYQYQELYRTDTTFAGGLNQSWIYHPQGDNTSELYVLRIPRSEEDRTKTVQTIQREYEGIGATEQGVGFQLRTIEEQARFIDSLSEKGFKTVKYLGINENTMLLPFLSGVSLHIFAETADTEEKFQVIGNILHHLARAHQKGITFGDRWCTNTMVFPDGDFVELDYDIELLGDPKTVQSFEMAQTVYHLIHFAGRNRAFMTDALQRFFLKNADVLEQYGGQKFWLFLAGHAEYFHSQDELYEGITPPYGEVYKIIDGLSGI